MQETTIRPRKSLRHMLSELWQFRELLVFFALRDIKVKYKETTLGVLWVLMQPLALTFLFSAIFSGALRVENQSLPYPVFVLAGLVCWAYVSGSITSAASGMEANSRIIRKIYFPRYVVPLSAVLSSAFDLLLTLAALVVFCAWHGVGVSAYNLITAMPLGLCILTLASMGFASAFSVANAIYKDFRYVVPFFVQLIFFTSPVFYDPAALVGSSWLGLLEWNPFAGGITIFRQALSTDPMPAVLFVKPAVSALFIFGAGFWIFRKTEHRIADLI